ncbi:HU domain-containing protein [Flavobacterium sp. GNP001]
MKIELYIAQLLYRYQCVTVPGFGAFLTEIQSARRNEATNSFSPPRKRIAFNTNLKNNDGLLANHIALAEKTSYEYAVSAIQYEVFAWKKALEEKQILVLKNIGDLRLNAENNIVFTPSETTNYLTSSFGLSTFTSAPVFQEETEVTNETIEVQNETPVYTLETEAARSINPYLKYAAVVAIALGLAGTVGYPMYQNQINSERLLVETAVQKQVQNKIQEATFFIKNPIPAVTLTVKATPEAKMPYHIMAGVYREEFNANKTLRALTQLGYNAKRIAPNKNGYFPVLYGSYATFAEAEKAKKEINEKHNPDAWILIQSL